MKFTNKVYDLLKVIALLWLPAAGTLYFALAAIWNLPDAQSVVGTTVAVDTFLGAILKLSGFNYTVPSDGKMVVDTSNPLKNTYQLQLGDHPEELLTSGKKQFTVDIVGPSHYITQEG